MLPYHNFNHTLFKIKNSNGGYVDTSLFVNIIIKCIIPPIYLFVVYFVTWNITFINDIR